MSDTAQLHTAEANPRATMAAGNEILRVIADFDPKAQTAVLRWVRTTLRRRCGELPVSRGVSRRWHPVTLGAHDAQIGLWLADGVAMAAVAKRLGCGIGCIRNRLSVLRVRAGA